MDDKKQGKKLNVPNLRFPEFTDEWRNDILQNVVTFSNGKAHENCVDEKGKYLLINSKFISSNGNVAKRVSLQLSPLIESQFVMVMSDLPNGKALAKCFYIEENNKYTLNQRICSFSSSPFCVSKFLMYQINRHSYFLRFDDGINQTNLKKNEVLSCPVNIPSKEEQEKIANFLTLIDKRIATQSKIIDKLQSLMSGLNDYLQENTEKTFSISFSEMGKDYSGLSGKSANDFGTGKAFVPYTNVYANTFIDEKNLGLVTIHEGERQSRVLRGDVLFTLSSETPEEVCYGSVFWGEEKELYLNSFCFGIHITNDNVFSPYLAYFVNSRGFRKKVFPLAQGSTRFNLQKSDFMHKLFNLPSQSNQKKIFNILKSIDKKISVEKSSLDYYQRQKIFLLNKMFI